VFQPITIEDFQERSGITSSQHTALWGNAEKVVSLRDIEEIHNAQAMPTEYLEFLISNITLVDNHLKPYRDCAVEAVGVDPTVLMIGQRFVEWHKIRSFLLDFPDIFNKFQVARGIVNRNALVVLGLASDGTHAIAHYLPPIVEENDGQQILLDGIHRNFLVNKIGDTLQAIRILNVKMPFPGSPQPWSAIKMVNEKPPKDERFFDLRPELFRDLKIVGIDG